MAREADALLYDLDLQIHAYASANRNIEIPYDRICRLLAIVIPLVPDEASEFIQRAFEAAEALPDSLTKQVLESVLRKGTDGFDSASISSMHRLFWNTRWQATGCPAVSVDERLCASLMLTESPREQLADLRLPWPCFLIRLPAGLVSYEGVAYTHVAFHGFQQAGPDPDDFEKMPDTPERRKLFDFMVERAGPKWDVVGLSGERGHFQDTATLEELLGAPREHLVEPEMDDDDPAHRLIGLFTRLAIGVCRLAETPGAIRTKSAKKGSRQNFRVGKAPLTTEYVLSSDVKLSFDGAQVVRAYIAGERRNLPRLQWIVRGHWRNQPIGPERSERKRIWIQPHWKGPADAPRLFREHVLGNTE